MKKKIYSIIVWLLITLISGCGGDQENPKSEIAGSWTMVAMRTNGITKKRGDLIKFNTLSKNINSTLEVNETAKTVTVSGSYNLVFRSSIHGKHTYGELIVKQPPRISNSLYHDNLLQIENSLFNSLNAQGELVAIGTRFIVEKLTDTRLTLRNITYLHPENDQTVITGNIETVMEFTKKQD